MNLSKLLKIIQLASVSEMTWIATEFLSIREHYRKEIWINKNHKSLSIVNCWTLWYRKLFSAAIFTWLHNDIPCRQVQILPLPVYYQHWSRLWPTLVLHDWKWMVWYPSLRALQNQTKNFHDCVPVCLAVNFCFLFFYLFFLLNVCKWFIYFCFCFTFKLKSLYKVELTNTDRDLKKDL